MDVLKVREIVCTHSSLPIYVLLSHVTALGNVVNHTSPFSGNGCSLWNPGPAEMATLPQYLIVEFMRL